MILDPLLRLVVAYGLIALVLLTAVALVFLVKRNTWQRRDARARKRLDEHYRRRDDAASAALDR